MPEWSYMPKRNEEKENFCAKQEKHTHNRIFRNNTNSKKFFQISTKFIHRRVSTYEKHFMIKSNLTRWSVAARTSRKYCESFKMLRIRKDVLQFSECWWVKGSRAIQRGECLVDMLKVGQDGLIQRLLIQALKLHTNSAIKCWDRWQIHCFCAVFFFETSLSKKGAMVTSNV